MANPPPYSQMRAQFDSLIDAGWARPCAVSRLSGTTDIRGHVVGSFVSKATGEQLWIQTISGRSAIDVKNLDAETTHLCYQKLTGFVLMPKDRILPSGEVYQYDVIHADVFETHRMSQLKQVLRT
jgi:hypothetical protein